MTDNSVTQLVLASATKDIDELLSSMKAGSIPERFKANEQLAELALIRIDERKDEDVDEWAETLAKDLVAFND